MCCHHENQAACCGHGTLPANQPPSAWNQRKVYFEGPVDEFRAGLSNAIQSVVPSVDLEWEGNALMVKVPDDEVSRLPVALRTLTQWLRTNAPEVKRSYVAPVLSDEDEGEGGFLCLHRTMLLIVGAAIFVVTLALSRWLPGFVSTVLYIISYLLIGQEVILNFVKNLRHREFLDETFLMTVASLGAFVFER